MKFAITTTNDHSYCAIKEFKTINDLIRFMKEKEYDLIITHNSAYKEKVINVQRYYPEVDAEELVKIPYEIEIYDGYRE